MLQGAISSEYIDPGHPFQLYRLLPAAVMLSNATSHYPKKTRPSVAFNMLLAGGVLSNVAGLCHTERAMLALLSGYRYGGEISGSLFNQVQSIIPSETLQLCKYTGRLMEAMYMIAPRSIGFGLTASGIQFRSKNQEQQSVYSCDGELEDDNVHHLEVVSKQANLFSFIKCTCYD